MKHGDDVKHGDDSVEHSNSAYTLQPLAKVAKAGEEALMEAADMFEAGLLQRGGSPTSNATFGDKSVASIATDDEKMMHSLLATQGAAATYFCTCNRVACTRAMLKDGHVSTQ